MKRTVTLAAFAILLAACMGDEGSSGATTKDATGPTAITGVTGTGPTGVTASSGPSGLSPEPEAELGDGEHFVFIESVDAGANTIVLDLAYFLTGEEANREAAERGLETPVPNDYFIVNDNPKLRSLALAPDVELALLDWNACCDTFIEGDLATFAAAIEAEDPITVDGQLYYGGLSPYWITVEGGTITRIEEQYLP